MKIRIAFAGLLLVTLAAACSSPTAPTRTDPTQRAQFDEAPAGDDKGGGALGSGS